MCNLQLHPTGNGGGGQVLCSTETRKTDKKKSLVAMSPGCLSTFVLGLVVRPAKVWVTLRLTAAYEKREGDHGKAVHLDLYSPAFHVSSYKMYSEALANLSNCTFS